MSKEEIAWCVEGVVNSLIVLEFEARVKGDEFVEVNRYPDVDSPICHAKGFLLFSLEYLVLLKFKSLPQSKPRKKKKRIDAYSQEGLEPKFKMICHVYETVMYLHFTL